VPTLEDTHDPSTSAITVDIAAGPPRDRPMVWAGAFSALLHLLLLLTIGVAGFKSSAPSSAPELRLYVEPADGRDAERDMAGPVERPAAPIIKPSEEVLASLAGIRSTTVGSLPRQARPSTPPTPDDSRGDSTPSTGDSAPAATPSTGSLPSDSPAAEGAVITTVGVSDREEPAQAVAARQQQPQVAVGSAQQSMLAHWIAQAAQGLQDANLTQARLSLQHKGRQYTAFLERRPATDEMDIDRVKVEITTEENGKRLRTLLQLKRLAFSHFTQLVDDWDGEVQLHDDEIAGRFHSNSEIVLGFDRVAPRLLGKVTTAAVRFRIANASGSRVMHEIFRGGIETKTARIALPANFPSLGRYPGSESTKVRSFAHATRVTFYSDGSYGWREIGSDAPEQRQAVSAPHYIVGSRGTIICLRGTVKGKVVVYSPEGIIVEGSLVYAHDPRSNPDADDYLGLISSKDVEIAPPDVTGPGDLEIHAAIYAKRRFVVTHEHAPGTATLLIHGSLTAGSLSATEPRYATKYDFDQRFEQVRPPGFPVTNRYEVETWDAQWREAEPDPPGAAAASVPLQTK
jgi:hypothetical protein